MNTKYINLWGLYLHGSYHVPTKKVRNKKMGY